MFSSQLDGCLLCFTGTWSSPEITGPRPPPCAGFSFTKVDLSRAVLFGGRQRHQRVNEVHILDMENRVNRSDTGSYWVSIVVYSTLLANSGIKDTTIS